MRQHLPVYVAAASDREERIAAIRRHVEQRATEERARQMRLPFPDWPERWRAAPNVMLRSALFGVVRRGRRKYVEEIPRADSAAHADVRADPAAVRRRT